MWANVPRAFRFQQQWVCGRSCGSAELQLGPRWTPALREWHCRSAGCWRSAAAGLEPWLGRPRGLAGPEPGPVGPTIEKNSVSWTGSPCCLRGPGEQHKTTKHAVARGLHEGFSQWIYFISCQTIQHVCMHVGLFLLRHNWCHVSFIDQISTMAKTKISFLNRFCAIVLTQAVLILMLVMLILVIIPKKIRNIINNIE